MMSDLTVLYYTGNRLPVNVAERIREHLCCLVVNRYPIISISQKPVDLGFNVCLGDIGFSVLSLYRQILIGALTADTEFVACCEDDVIYTLSYFQDFRPKRDEFAYNVNRWGVYLWQKYPSYSYKNRCCMCLCIAPRKLLIEALIERFSSEIACDKALRFFGEPGRYENYLRVTVRKIVRFNSVDPSIVFSHLYALGAKHLGRRKKLGINACKNVLPWGDVNDLIKKFWGQELWDKQIAGEV